jgi:PAS domain S-box-containing protein
MQYHEAGYEEANRRHSSPLWFQISSLVLLGVAIALLLVVLGNRVYNTGLSFAVLLAVLLALACAAFLHIRSLLKERKEHRETASAFYATEREFTSVFQHALDAILILDNEGICLNANPAALALLGVPRAGLVGHSFAQFHADRQEFEREWHGFLKRNYRRGQAELLRWGGGKLFVYYTAAANYLPGRHVVILCDTTERVEAQDSLRKSEERLRQMADNIQEIFWMMDARNKEVLYVNRAYETITGRSLESIVQNPCSYADLIHASDRMPVLAKLEEAVHSGHLNEEFRILRPDAEVRWVWVKAFPVRDDGDKIRLLVGTVQDITARKLADAQVAHHLATAEAAREQAEASRAEAEALRKATLALTQNLRMDAVLDTLLCCLLEIVPYDVASVILTEPESRLFVAREVPPAPAHKPVVTLDAAENVFLQRVLLERKSVFLPDTREETEWTEITPLAHIRSWLCVPLVASDRVLGLLSIGNGRPQTFTTEHFRLAKSLAVPAAVAIHNARIYEWAEIYAEERQQLLKQADPAHSAAENCDRRSDPPF